MGEDCDYYEFEITYGPEGCGEALQLNWSAIGYYYELQTICIDDVKIFGIPINNPPNAPTIIGPTSGKVSVEYNYTISAVDPNGDNVTYYIHWGDSCGGHEWYGPYPSGEEIIVSHYYSDEGTFILI